MDGQSTHDLPLAELRLMLEGKPGTRSRFRSCAPSSPIPTRSNLRVPWSHRLSSRSSLTKIHHSLPQAGHLTAARVDEIAAKIKSAGKGHKILLDLRDTSGDELKQGLRLANLFIRTGNLASLEGQNSSSADIPADPAVCITDAPVAVLVNRGTYGAPELAAAAIED